MATYPVYPTVQGHAVRQLRERLHGDVLQPWDEEFDRARRVYNALHDRWPALIVRAQDAQDVASAVRFADRHHLSLAVRGGGHSIAGFSTCDGGLVLDLSQMRDVRLDVERRRVLAAGGCTWADLDRATHAFGLATTGGLVSTTGIAGLTLGGGLGHLARQCGLACDNLVSAEVVTADGEILTCSENVEPDLFWALRGGGGNFGVVTALEYRLHPVETVLAGPTVFPLGADVFSAYDGFLRTAPEDLGLVLTVALAPPVPFIPESWHGRPVCIALACWTGAVDVGHRLLAELDDWAPVIGRYVEPMPYPVANTLFDEDLPSGLRHYWKAHFVRDLTDEDIAVHVEHSSRVPNHLSGPLLFPIDGACHRVAPDATAFAYRDARFVLALCASWAESTDDEANQAWLRDYDDAVQAHTMGGGYVNIASADDNDRVPSSYRQNHDRLVEAKRRYDPTNLFRLNQNIRPD